MRFIFSLILGLFFATLSLLATRPISSSLDKNASSLIRAVAATPVLFEKFSATNKVELNVYVDQDYLALYVSQALSLSNFWWGVSRVGSSVPNGNSSQEQNQTQEQINWYKLTTYFDAFALTNLEARAKDCYVYERAGTKPILPSLCTSGNLHPIQMSRSDVFWYDEKRNTLKDIGIYRDKNLDSRQICSSAEPSCTFYWDRESATEGKPLPTIGIAPFIDCSQSADNIRDKINLGLRNITFETTIEGIEDRTVARAVAEQKHYDILIWWGNNNNQEFMQIEILKVPPSKEIQELSSIQIPIERCDLEHATQFAKVMIEYQYANVDAYPKVDAELKELTAIVPKLAPQKYEGKESPPALAVIAFFRGNIQLYAQQPNYLEAIGQYNIALQAFPHWADAYFNLGVAYLNQGYDYLFEVANPDVYTLEDAKISAVTAFAYANTYSNENGMKAQASLSSARTLYSLGYMTDDRWSNYSDYRIALGNCLAAQNMTGVALEIQAQADVCHAAIEIQRCGQSVLYYGINCGSETELKPAMDYLQAAIDKDPLVMDIYLWRGVALSLQYEYGCRLEPPVFSAELKSEIVENLKKYWHVVQLDPIQLSLNNANLTYARKEDRVINCGT